MNGSQEKYNIYLLGVNHRVAPVEIRERVAFEPEEIPKYLQRLLKQDTIQEALILSTCNRTEICVVSSATTNIENILKNFLRHSRESFYPENLELFYFYEGDAAIRHIFRVSAGLDSMVLGEPQILGQVKDAFRMATEAGATRSILNRLMNFAIIVGKRVRSETGLGAGAVSVAYAAVELAEKIFKNLYNHNVLLIGAGETGKLTAQHLKEKGIQNIYITNRTHQKAVELAGQLEGKAIPFDRFLEILPEIDVVIGAATAPAPAFLIDASSLRQVLSRRKNRPLFLIDIAVPRDFDPEINRLDNVFLHDIDHLQQIIDRNLEKRRQEIPAAEKIVEQELQNFIRWKNTLHITPTIVALREKLEEIRHLELDKYRHKVSPEEFEKLEMVTRGMINKILHLPMVQLRKYNDGNLDGLLRIDVVRELFGLEVKDEQNN